MARKRGLSRRELLRGGLGAVGVGLIAACAPQAPAQPTAAPAKPTEAPKPAAATQAPAAATQAPAAAATQAPAAAAPAATKPAAPAAAGKPAEPKLGAQLIGKLEGPELVADPAGWPGQFKEAPMLAELVKQGALPPVEQRVPQEPMVVKPVHETGRYGGTWRRGFTGPADGENGNRIVSTDKLLFWDYTGTKNAPSVAKEWKTADDGRTMTVVLRKGMRWSDGTPFTADDFVFWYEDIYQNKDLVRTPTPELATDGKPGTIEKVDDYTIAFKFPEPYHLLLDILSGDTHLGGGQAVRQSGGAASLLMGAYAPAHYLKQFHAKFAGAGDLDRQIQGAAVDNWVSLMRLKMDWQRNPDLPVLTPWKTVSPINTPNWILERNPYYWAVDAAGNQLPYIDRIHMTLAENLEVLNLRAIAGEYDLQERHVDLGKLPVLLENQQKGNYTVYLDPAENGADTALHVNQTYDADPEIARWLTQRDFRRALSLGIDRDQLNETFWLGIGVPGSGVPADESPYNPGPEWRARWSTHDPKQANELLDKLGLDKKDAEGYRLRTDGRGRLRIEMWAVAGAFVPYVQHAEMIAAQWKQIGIQGDVRELERSLAFQRATNNEHHILLWSNGGSEQIYLFPHHALPANASQAFMAPLAGKWYASNGQQGREPTDPQMKRALDLFGAAAGQRSEERLATAREIWKILVDEQWSIGTVGVSPAFMGVRVASNRLGNIPARQANAQHARTPGTSHPATFYFKA